MKNKQAYAVALILSIWIIDSTYGAKYCPVGRQCEASMECSQIDDCTAIARANNKTKPESYSCCGSVEGCCTRLPSTTTSFNVEQCKKYNNTRKETCSTVCIYNESGTQCKEKKYNWCCPMKSGCCVQRIDVKAPKKLDAANNKICFELDPEKGQGATVTLDDGYLIFNCTGGDDLCSNFQTSAGAQDEEQEVKQ